MKILKLLTSQQDNIWNVKEFTNIQVIKLASPPNAQVAAMTSMRTNNFKTLRLTNTLESFSKHFWIGMQGMQKYAKVCKCKSMQKYEKVCKSMQ